ncbi:RNA polymerase sigma factor [Edaphobacter sp. 12200R-103]|uniref:RNA polymerase sigma factor n=1 Tax=Edaphobacter sp. 12200R-103 TaxID=2703788 RepID=UPI00138CF561|nr:RNA polymerase sigma factor [Edaphobacter sp. 12200R-103]QHS51175.1 sigma-70 family RNA polymerase sigma factor [Edaphobacter sp. 12200R-103]
MSSSVANLIEQRSRFLSFVQRRVHDRNTAEDILQMAYLKAVSNADTLKVGRSADAWFFRILRNAVIDHYRHQAVETRTFEPWEPGIEPPSTTPDLTPANLCPCVAKALHKVPASYREILREVDLQEVSLENYAKRTGITHGNAAVRSHRAHRSLREKLMDHCGSCAQAGCLDCTCRPSATRQ